MLKFVVFGLVLTSLLMTSKGQVVNQPQFIHMSDPCPPEEQCPGHPEAKCVLDCISLDANGQGVDCVMHFYDPHGNMLPCWFF